MSCVDRDLFCSKEFIIYFRLRLLVDTTTSKLYHHRFYIFVGSHCPDFYLIPTFQKRQGEVIMKMKSKLSNPLKTVLLVVEMQSIHLESY